jgi:hypothetical protein
MMTARYKGPQGRTAVCEDSVKIILAHVDASNRRATLIIER